MGIIMTFLLGTLLALNLAGIAFGSPLDYLRRTTPTSKLDQTELAKLAKERKEHVKAAKHALSTAKRDARHGWCGCMELEIGEAKSQLKLAKQRKFASLPDFVEKKLDLEAEIKDVIHCYKLEELEEIRRCEWWWAMMVPREHQPHAGLAHRRRNILAERKYLSFKYSVLSRFT